METYPQSSSSSIHDSNNTTSSHNISNSYNSITSNIVNPTNVFVFPQDRQIRFSTPVNHLVIEEEDEVERNCEESLSDLHNNLGTRDSVSHGYVRHQRADSATAVSVRSEIRRQALTKRSLEGTCKLRPLDNLSIPLPPKTLDYIEQYIRSGFKRISSDWISLWVPSPVYDPGSTHHRRPRSIGLGDVGYFRDRGEFEVLFNIYLSEEANANNHGHPPINFIPYDPGIHPRHQWIDRPFNAPEEKIMMTGDLEERHENGPRLQHSVADSLGSQPVFSLRSPITLPSATGTTLIIPDGMERFEFTVAALAEMQSYFDEHASTWYDFYNRIGSEKRTKFEDGSLLFVRACYRTNAWAKASFKDCTQRVCLDLYKHDALVNVYTWAPAVQSNSVNATTGPPPGGLENSRTRESAQCIAVELSSLEVKTNNLIEDMAVSLQSFFVSKRSSLASRASTIKGLFKRRR